MVFNSRLVHVYKEPAKYNQSFISIRKPVTEDIPVAPTVNLEHSLLIIPLTPTFTGSTMISLAYA